jgi:hypothetical protein
VAEHAGRQVPPIDRSENPPRTCSKIRVFFIPIVCCRVLIAATVGFVTCVAKAGALQPNDFQLLLRYESGERWKSNTRLLLCEWTVGRR